MAMPRKLPVDFGIAFPHGAYAVSRITPVSDYDRSTADNKVQQVDKETGLPLWQVEVVDADPDAKKATRTIAVKIAAKVQPTLPNNDTDTPFTPVRLDDLVVTPYVEQVTEDFSRIAWSFRAGSIAPVGQSSRPSPAKTAEKSVA